MNAAAFAVIFNRFVDNVTHVRLEGLHNGELVLLLQDDVVLPADFSSKFKRSYHALPHNWTVARLSWWGERRNADVVNEYWSHCPIVDRYPPYKEYTHRGSVAGVRQFGSNEIWQRAESRTRQRFRYMGSGAVLLRAGKYSVSLNNLLQRSTICWEDGAYLSHSAKKIASYVHTDPLIELAKHHGKSIIQEEWI